MRSTSRSTSKRGGASVLASRSRPQQLVSILAPPRAAVGRSDTAALLRREFRAWRASLPTQLERDTLLWPEVIAESVVQEAELFLKADLPDNFAERLAAKAHNLYPRHKNFHKILNRSGNQGRDSLYMFMRHWKAGWLKRARSPLFQRLPWAYSYGRRLP